MSVDPTEAIGPAPSDPVKAALHPNMPVNLDDPARDPLLNTPGVEMPATDLPKNPARDVGATPPSKVRCPTCHNPIQLAKESNDVLCPGCGSAFRLRDAQLTNTTAAMMHLGKFQLLERLGIGGFGAVWKARDTELDRIVALKIPHSGLLTQREELERFQREARAAANLRHPNIVTVYNVETLNGLPVIVSEFIPGVPLNDMLDTRPLTFRQSAALVAQVAEALDYAHSMGVVHRDVKPANIMILRESHSSAALGSGSDKPDELADVGKPMILDFGLALRDTIETTMTIDGQLLGTPAYMSPEQAAGKGHEADRRSDVYSLGVVLYQLLTGELPFRGSPSMVLYQVQHDEPTAPRKINDKVPPDLETICLKCLAKWPAQRYATARELADDLRRFLAGEPILARPVGTVERLLRWCQRNPALAATGTTAGLGVLLALFAFATAYFAISQSFDRESAERKKAEDLAKAKQKLALDNEKLAIDADQRREKAEHLAMRVEFERYYAKAQERPDYALAGMASLLPRAVRLKDSALADQLRLHLGAWRASVPRLTAMWTHDDFGTAVALSADGRMALTASGNVARLWDTATGQAIGPQLEHKDQIMVLALSADGKLALTACLAGKVQLWDTATGTPTGMTLSPDDLVDSVALSADGKRAMTASGTTTQLWETATGKAIGKPLHHEIRSRQLALSGDGSRALMRGFDNTAWAWDTATGKVLGRPLRHDGIVSTMALSTDGKTALTATSDGTTRVWQTDTGAPIGPALSHPTDVVAVALTADGKTALTGSRDHTARLWDTATGKPIGSPLPHGATVGGVALSADGAIALTVSDDNTARIWQKPEGDPVRRSLGHPDPIRAVALSADGKTALVGSRNEIFNRWIGTLVDTATGDAVAPALLPQQEVMAMALSADGKMALFVNSDYVARLWDTTAGKQIGQPLQHDGFYRALALSANGRIALTADTANTSGLWDAATCTPVGKPLRHDGIIRAVALSADGKIALTGSDDKTARLWDTATGKPIGLSLRHTAEVFAVALSADGAVALTGGNDLTARLWLTATGAPIGPPLRHQGPVYAVACSADGSLALTACADRTARLWDTATGRTVGPPLHDQVWPVELSADGKTALTLNFEGTATVWNMPRPIRGDPERINLWAQVITGTEVDEVTAVRVLDAKTWHERRHQLQKLGGPPAIE